MQGILLRSYWMSIGTEESFSANYEDAMHSKESVEGEKRRGNDEALAREFGPG